MTPNTITSSLLNASRARLGMFLYLAVLLALLVPGIAFGYDANDASDAITTTCGFASNIKSILNAVSIVVVTIAVIFAGYQIAFAHKRISDVAPVLIGGILIGAAGQIASMFLKTSAGTNACTTSLISHALNHYA